MCTHAVLHVQTQLYMYTQGLTCTHTVLHMHTHSLLRTHQHYMFKHIYGGQGGDKI